MTKQYDNSLLNYLIRQCKDPSGIVGSKMTAIWNNTFRNMTHWGIQKIQFSSNDYILDIGCGGGATVNEFAEFISENGKVYGIDISTVAVRNSQKKNRIHIQRNKVEILQSSVEKLPFSADMFDKIFAVQTHIYWRNIEQGLSEILRILKPNGDFYIICEKDKIAYHLQNYENSFKMVELLKQTGFSAVDYNENRNWIEYICVK
ncbi:methyltransferase family protein [Kineothrix alysoides]|uniref:Methyltransferase family protein n=1 Tax=Kineothrix alysoides TaxID=1469948 RepID=A0A4R1R0X1_9FIRM|nr:class I SAM-dependent methyltransferase [Kineothrix alysoides]TCL58954.1 methyltransferase family protein [Kineothrix alysoides]